MGKRDDEDWHGWRETRDRFAEDMLLRSFNWEIHARPDGKPALWRIKGTRIIKTHAEAIETVKRWMEKRARV